MLEREWVWWKQAIACQYGYSTSHVATVNYVIEVCLYPPLLSLLPLSVRAPSLSPDQCLRTVHLVPLRLSCVTSTCCGHEEHEREQPVLRTSLALIAGVRLLCVCAGSHGIGPCVSSPPCPWAQC